MAVATKPLYARTLDAHRDRAGKLIHAHLEFPGGHLESAPYVFNATAGKTVVTLHPDAPRNLRP